MEAKHVGNRFIQLHLLPIEQILTRRNAKPKAQIYNFISHEFAATACFYRQLHLDAA